MAAGTYADMAVYQEQFQSGMYETVAQAINVFNSSSRGAIVLEPATQDEGNYYHEAMFALVDGFRRRTLSSTADISAVKLSQIEEIAPKISWALGPVADTEDAFAKIGKSPEEMAYIVGQQSGPIVFQAMVNSVAAALRGIFAATGIATTLVYDATALSGNLDLLTFKNLRQGLNKFGDAQQQIVAWLMHSASFNHLCLDGLDNYKLDTVAGNIALVSDIPQAAGRTIIVTDAPQLASAGTSASGDESYNVYGLVPGAIRVRQSENTRVLIDRKTGVNIQTVFQAEGAYTLRAKGVKFSTSDLNPSDATLATSSKWTKVASSVKSLPGVCIKTDQT